MGEITESFSLVAGGPAHHLMLRLGLAGREESRVGRRVLTLVAVAWLPLLALTWGQGTAFAGVALPFSRDWLVNVRLLLALPILVAAEPMLGGWVSAAVKQLVGAGIVRERDLSRYEEAVARSAAWRDSILAEALLLGLAVSRAVPMARNPLLGEVVSWRTTPAVFGGEFSAAGWWHTLVSSPLLQFVIYRWGWRYVIWCVFLWRTSRLDLRLTPIHPDGSGGLGFLKVVQARFGVIMFALSAVVSSAVGERARYLGISVMDSRFLLIGFLVLAVVIVLAPLLVFSGKLVRTRAQGWMDYGQLGSKYAAAFHERWVTRGSEHEEELLGTSDIQSLADMEGSFGIVRNMKPVPFDLSSILSVALAAALPMLPLVLSVVPLSEILKALANVLL
jgi:hypothetical protein